MNKKKKKKDISSLGVQGGEELREIKGQYLAAALRAFELKINNEKLAKNNFAFDFDVLEFLFFFRPPLPDFEVLSIRAAF